MRLNDTAMMRAEPYGRPPPLGRVRSEIGPASVSTIAIACPIARRERSPAIRLDVADVNVLSVLVGTRDEVRHTSSRGSGISIPVAGHDFVALMAIARLALRTR